MSSDQVENAPITIADVTTSRVGPARDGGEGRPSASSHLDELLALDEIGRQINSSIELATVLREVAAAATRLLGSDGAWVHLLQPEDGSLVLKAWEGIGDESAAAFGPLKIGEGVAGRAAQKDRPVVVDDLLHASSNYPDLEALALMTKERLRAAVAVPVHSKTELVGVLGVQSRTLRQFTDYEVSLLGRLANQAGIAIQNARLYERERQKVAELQESNRLISLQREQLAQSITIHDRLTQLAVVGGGCDALASTLAGLVANPVVVLNRFGQTIAVATRREAGWPGSGELGRTLGLLADKPSVKRLLQELAESGRLVREAATPEEGIPPRVAVPIMAERRVWGYVLALEYTRPLTELDNIAIEHAATVMALEMMREKTAFEVEIRLKGGLLEALLSVDGADDSAILNRAAYLGCDLKESHCFAMLGIDDSTEEVRAAEHHERRLILLQERLFDLVNAVVREDAPRSLVVAKHDAIIMLLNVPECRIGIKRFLDGLRARVARHIPEITVSIGVGRECHDLADFRQSCDEAKRALLILRNTGRRNETIWFEQLAIHDLLFRSGEPELVRFVERSLGRLIAYDRQHDAQLVITLATYLDCALSLRKCARLLHVHKNTVLYRLQRLNEISGIDVADPEARLRAQLALHLMRSLGRQHPSTGDLRQTHKL